MRYSCEDVKYFLEHDEMAPTDEAGFLNHLENCGSCRELATLEPELEEIISVSIPKASPLSFKKDILPEILKSERSSAKQKKIDKITLPVMVLVSLIPMSLIAFFWKEIRTLPDVLNLTGAYDKLAAFISGIDLSRIDLTGITGFISETPLLTVTLISIAALIWAFSIIEAQRALK